jgi:hypothetical protein
MVLAEPSSWSDVLQRTLERYDEPLLRRVAGRLIKPRNQWPVAELVERCAATAGDVTVIDRRLRELEPADRQLLALIGHSRQPLWGLGNLVELLASLGHQDGLRSVLSLLEAGLLLPFLGLERAHQGVSGNGPSLKQRSIKSFEQWLTFADPENLRAFAHPLAMTRAIGEDLGMGECPGRVEVAGPVPVPVHEADGLEWLLRLAVLWQQVAGAPLRRTQQGEFFKRDLERLDSDPLLNGASAEGLPVPPDAGFLAVALAEAVGVLRSGDGELRAGELPAAWEEGLPASLEQLFKALPHLRAWNPLDGWTHERSGEASVGHPFPSACLLVLLLLSRLPADGWARPEALSEWVLRHHPYWSGEEIRPSRRRDWVATFLLGLAYPLRLVQAANRLVDAKDATEWAVRLSPLGRWLLGLAGVPAAESFPFPKTLLVQPNLEIVAYRQGLTPALIGRLARFAAWRSLGSACTLQLGPESVYRALEGGLTFESILQTLEQHGTRALPAAVVDSLRTWSNKRERISVYPSAALLEFGTAEDLNAALARGFPGVRLSDRLAVVASESAIDYSLFRLTASRDYAAQPEQCVALGEDGVTLTVDLNRSDLMLESELSRFAEPVGGLAGAASNGRLRQFRLTPTSLAAARSAGVNAQSLEVWFRQRVGQPVSAAALLLLTGSQEPTPTLRRHLVLHVATTELADGLMQWPATRALIHARLGPTALSVAAEDVAPLREQLSRAGISLADPS